MTCRWLHVCVFTLSYFSLFLLSYCFFTVVLRFTAASFFVSLSLILLLRRTFIKPLKIYLINIPAPFDPFVKLFYLSTPKSTLVFSRTILGGCDFSIWTKGGSLDPDKLSLERNEFRSFIVTNVSWHKNVAGFFLLKNEKHEL